MLHSSSLAKTYRRLARCIDRFFNGECPSELPFDQQTKGRLVINQRTAKAIGLAIPRSPLLRADEVVA